MGLFSGWKPPTDPAVRYDIVYASGLDDLAKLVNQPIAEEWVPQGGVAESRATFSQAMVRSVPAK